MIFKYSTQVKVQWKTFEWLAEQRGSNKAFRVFPAFLNRARSPATSTTPEKMSNSGRTRENCW